MTTKIFRHHVWLALLVLVCGCASRTETGPAQTLRHARLLTLEASDSFVVATVNDPWHAGRVLHSYVLVPRQQPLPQHLPAGTLVRVPLQKSVAFSAVHASLALDLGALNAVCGVCDANYIVRKELRDALAARRLADFGSSMQPGVEQLMAAGADALLVSPFENAGYGLLEQAGIPLIECADYMEPTPLGRAEWMRFYGLLWGRGSQADSLFSEVEHAYTQLAERVSASKEQGPALLTDYKQGAAWYVPAGGSYLATLYADAGARYVFADRPGSGSLPLAPEEVYARAGKADVWLVKYGAGDNYTRTSFADGFPLAKRFKPWQTGQMYGCNTFSVPYYEEVPFRPQLLLADMVHLFHPALLPQHSLRYYSRLQP